MGSTQSDETSSARTQIDFIPLQRKGLISSLLSAIILPAQSFFKKKRKKKDPIPPAYESEAAALIGTGTTTRVGLVETDDGHQLYTVGVSPNYPRGKAPSPKEQKIVIHLLGNAEDIQDKMLEMYDERQKLGCSVIGFNYRGVNESTGRTRSHDDMVKDAIFQINRLLKKGARPENITLKGFSIGAATAARVGAIAHQQGIPIRVFCDRTFSSLPNVVTHKDFLKHHPSRGMRMLGWFARRLPKKWVKGFLERRGWGHDIAKAYRSIPQEYRDHTIIQGKQGYAKDEIIPTTASLHHEFYEKEKEEAQSKGITVETLEQEARTKEIHPTEAVRMKKKGRVLADSTHSRSLSDMQPTQEESTQETAESRFHEFVRREVPPSAATTKEIPQETQSTNPEDDRVAPPSMSI